MSPLLTLFVIAVLGLIVGSFLNVVILRFDTGLSMVRGRSRCFSCNHDLSWYELLPLFSFIFQLGKCGHCGSRISWQYPLVELSTALLFVFSFSRAASVGLSLPFTIALAALISLIMAIIVVIFVYDIRHKIIPDFFSYLLACAALALSAASDFRGIGYSLLAAIAFFLFFWAFWYFSKGTWMGLGDAKLAVSVGLLLSLSGGTVALLFAFWSGAIVALLLLIWDKISSRKVGISMKSEIPFAPFIIFGFIVVFFSGIDLGTLSSWLAI